MSSRQPEARLENDRLWDIVEDFEKNVRPLTEEEKAEGEAILRHEAKRVGGDE